MEHSLFSKANPSFRRCHTEKQEGNRSFPIKYSPAELHWSLQRNFGIWDKEALLLFPHFLLLLAHPLFMCPFHDFSGWLLLKEPLILLFLHQEGKTPQENGRREFPPWNLFRLMGFYGASHSSPAMDRDTGILSSQPFIECWKTFLWERRNYFPLRMFHSAGGASWKSFPIPGGTWRLLLGSVPGWLVFPFSIFLFFYSKIPIFCGIDSGMGGLG